MRVRLPACYLVALYYRRWTIKRAYVTILTLETRLFRVFQMLWVNLYEAIYRASCDDLLAYRIRLHWQGLHLAVQSCTDAIINL